MKIAVTGDTHGQIKNVMQALKKQPTEAILFTGDHVRDGKRLGEQLGLPMYSVAGNCDFLGAGENEILIELAGKKFLLTHGHRLGVKRGLQSLYYRAQEAEVHAAVFGHTHVPFCREIDGIWFINPGSPTYPRGLSPKGTYAIIRVEKSGIYPVVLML